MASTSHYKRFNEALLTIPSGADLSALDLSGAFAKLGKLIGAKLCDSDLTRADLSSANLQNADLSRAILSRANLGSADLRDATLVRARMKSANLSHAIMNGANLQNADLENAWLIKASVRNVRFDGANLKKTDLRGAKDLIVEQIKAAKNWQLAIYDAVMGQQLGLEQDVEMARYGFKLKKPCKPTYVELFCREVKPTFGDLFTLTGDEHPEFPPSGAFDFSKVEALKIQQVDDAFAMCKGRSQDPLVWVYPMLKNKIVYHHPGPFDGVFLEHFQQRPTAKSSADLLKVTRALQPALNAILRIHEQEISFEDFERALLK